MVQKKHIRVLSIHGGGVKGIIPAVILHNITTRAGRPVTELFDYIIGTSVGGIIATALTIPKGLDNKTPRYTTQDILDMLLNDAKKIFPEYLISFFPRTQWIGAKYPRTGIDNFLKDKAGEYTLKDTVKPIAMVSYSLDQNKPRLWSTYKAERSEEKNFKLYDAAGATSAAPTYFPCKITQDANGNTMKDVDGGIFANAPTMWGLAELKNKFPGLTNQDITVISLGTGVAPRSGDTKDSWFDGRLSWAKTLHDIMMQASETTDKVLSAEFLGSRRYVHINCPISEEQKELDNTDAVNLNSLKVAAETCLNTRTSDDLVRNIVQCLNKLEQGESCDITAAHVVQEFKLTGSSVKSVGEEFYDL